MGPKLLPTVPVHVQAFPALLVHRAVAVAPTARQLTARFSRSSGVGEAIAIPAKAKSRVVENNMISIDMR